LLLLYWWQNIARHKSHIDVGCGRRIRQAV
jgi:hypothetical protein